MTTPTVVCSRTTSLKLLSSLDVEQTQGARATLLEPGESTPAQTQSTQPNGRKSERRRLTQNTSADIRATTTVSAKVVRSSGTALGNRSTRLSTGETAVEIAKIPLQQQRKSLAAESVRLCVADRQGPQRRAVEQPSPVKSAMGFCQFLLRGLQGVRGEWSLVTMAWNIHKTAVFQA